VSSDDPITRGRAFQTLVLAYWKPVYKTIRTRWRKDRDEAQDLTQAFFARAFEKDVFEQYDPARARFRTFLRSCLHNYLANEAAGAARLKRGGGTLVLSLDFEGADGELDAAVPLAASPEEEFDRELARSLHELALSDLRERLAGTGRARYWSVFERYELAAGDRPTYAALAAELGITVTDVTNHLHFARRELRRILCDRLRRITASDEEYRSEARELFGVDVDDAARA
jgi:RNA polymerase sigma factor (sigma-70 family)